MQEDIQASLRIINAHHQVCLCHSINLQVLSEVVGKNGKLHRGRPTMVSCRIMRKRVLFFPNGTVQVLGGGVTPILLTRLLEKIKTILQQCKLTILPNSSAWTVNNIVYKFDYNKHFKFDNCVCNSHFSFEPELFPAALISKWSPAHVTLFTNGKGLITGIKDRDSACSILRELPTFLSEYVYCN